MHQLKGFNVIDDHEIEEIRVFLRTLYIANDNTDHSWLVQRFDYCLGHVYKNCYHSDFKNAVYYWRNEVNKIVAMACSEGEGNVYLHILPNYNVEELVHAVVKKSEASLYSKNAFDLDIINIWIPNSDLVLKRVLDHRAFNLITDKQEFLMCCDLETDLAKIEHNPELNIRYMRYNEDFPKRSWASWKVFHPNTDDKAYTGWEWYHNILDIPNYRNDLDLIVLDEKDNVVAFCTIWLDKETNTAYLEPMGVLTEHRSKGIGKQLLSQALKKAKEQGANKAFVGAHSERVKHFYESVGFIYRDKLVVYSLIIDE